MLLTRREAESALKTIAKISKKYPIHHAQAEWMEEFERHLRETRARIVAATKRSR